MKERLGAHHMRTGTAIVVIAAAAWIFRGILVTFLIEPIGWLLWAGWRVLTSIDQGICWASLVVVCAALVIRFALAAAGPHGEMSAQPEEGGVGGDRLAHWQAAAARAEGGSEGRRAILASLEPLALSVSEMTRTRLPRPASEQSSGGAIAWLARRLPNHRRRAELRTIEELLAGMESALEITNERESESDHHN